MFGLTGVFGILAGIFSFSAYLFYIVSILKGDTKPSRATWFIWAVMGIIILFSYKSLGATDTLWMALSEALGPIIIAILCIKHGVGGTTKLDILCFLGSVFSLILWWMFDSPLAALITNLSIDLFAAIPTVRKTWTHPKQEDKFAWTLTQIGVTFGILALNTSVFAIVVYPIYRFIIDGIVIFTLYRPAPKKKLQYKY